VVFGWRAARLARLHGCTAGAPARRASRLARQGEGRFHGSIRVARDITSFVVISHASLSLRRKLRARGRRVHRLNFGAGLAILGR